MRHLAIVMTAVLASGLMACSSNTSFNKTQGDVYTPAGDPGGGTEPQPAAMTATRHARDSSVGVVRFRKSAVPPGAAMIRTIGGGGCGGKYPPRHAVGSTRTGKDLPCRGALPRQRRWRSR